MNPLTLALLLFFFGCATAGQEVPKKPVAYLRITEVAPNRLTALTRQNLEHLFQIYHLAPLLFTGDIDIQTGAVPRSHPTLRINTRYAEKPHYLLSAFVHEELHWWAESKKQQMVLATNELKLLYPKQTVPLLQHLIICFLEYDVLTYFLKKSGADEIILGLIHNEKIHPWIYSQVLNNYKSIDVVIRKRQLRPKI